MSLPTRPTSRQSKLVPLPLVSPGFKGLNTQLQSSVDLLGPEWALELQNSVFGDDGRLTSRKGWVDQATTPIAGTPDVEVVHEFLQADGTSEVILATATALFSGTQSYTDITGSLTFSGSNWQFLNFNDLVIGVKSGETPIAYNGTGTFASITAVSGTLPTGDAGLAAFGRLWIVGSDGVTVQYSALLDHTRWAEADGGGSIDLSNVWTRGTDSIVGLAAFGATLVVFGRRHIVLYTDGTGSVLGIDPDQMYVVDTIEGTGLIGKNTIENIGEGDLWFLSPNGVQSLRRVIDDKNNPLITVTRNVRDLLRGFVQGESSADQIQAVYNAEERFYLLNLPDSERIFMLDTTFPLEDGSARVSEWVGIAAKSVGTRVNGDVLFGFDGRLGLHTGFLDNTANYRWIYRSPHLDLGDDLHSRLKIMKRLGSISFIQRDTDLVFKWGFDFGGLNTAVTRALPADGLAEWGTAEFGANGVFDATNSALTPGVDVSEFGGGLSLRIVKVPTSGSGQFIQVGLEVIINASEFGLQELVVFSKIGRMI